MLSFQSRVGKTSYLFMVPILLFFSILILWNANWVFDIFYVDDEQFVSATAVGKSVYAWSGASRFWPLGLFDYNWLLLLFPQGASPFVHFLYNCVTMYVTSFSLFSYLNHIFQEKIKISWACMGILFISSCFLRLYMMCTYPERQLILMLSLFLWFYWKGINENSKKYQLLALFAAIYATYLKEPVFVIWVVFALSNLLFGKACNVRYLNYALLINSAIWLLLYLINFASIDQGSTYHGASFIPKKLMLRSFDHDPFMFILLILGFVRGWLVVFRKDKFDIFTDAPLFAGVAYTLVYAVINVHEYYLVVPSLILELPALGKFLLRNNNKLRKTVITLLCLCLPISLFNSIRTVRDIHWHRTHDSIVFHKMIDASKSGSKIFYFSKYGNDDGNLTFKRYKTFFDYYSESNFPLIRCYNPDDIDENSIVILCKSDQFKRTNYFAQIRERVQKCKLELFHSNKEIFTEIYSKLTSTQI